MSGTEEKMSVKGIVASNGEKKHKEADAFYHVFGVPITKYMHPLFGFEVILFDEFINPPDGTSLAQAVEDKYGLEGYNILARLMDIPEKKQ